MMLAYGARRLGLTEFTSKIGADNAPSLALFASLGFAQESFSEYFREATLRLVVADSPQIAAVAMDEATLAGYFVSE